MYFNRYDMLQASAPENIIVIIVGTLILSLLGGFIISFLLIYNRKQEKNRQEKQTLQSQFQQELLQTQLEIQEQTLKNISEEIHDNIGQVLSLAKLNLNTLGAGFDETQQQKITNSKNLVSKAISDLRDLSHSLNTDYVQEMGLLRAIEYELELIKKTGAVETEMNTEGPVTPLDKQKELILFRIVQEVLNNIIKHAKAKKISVDAVYSPDAFQLTVADDGQGVDLSPLIENKQSGFGLGIRNMHNRANLIGADFSMNSTLGKGTTVKIILKKPESDKTPL